MFCARLKGLKAEVWRGPALVGHVGLPPSSSRSLIYSITDRRRRGWHLPLASTVSWALRIRDWTRSEAGELDQCVRRSRWLLSRTRDTVLLAPTRAINHGTRPLARRRDDGSLKRPYESSFAGKLGQHPSLELVYQLPVHSAGGRLWRFAPICAFLDYCGWCMRLSR